MKRPRGIAHAEGRSDGVQDLYGSLRPVVVLATAIVQIAPVVCLVGHFWSLPPNAFLRAWFLEPEVVLPYWLATSFVIWASFVTLLVLARWPSTRPLVLRDAAAYKVFGRRAAEAAIV